ncbi:MAG: SEL1-like repeat protein [Proteobacteria bacterium]|nr:SEL1-like repeat protein [Pseudomonadota bacterium]
MPNRHFSSLSLAALLAVGACWWAVVPDAAAADAPEGAPQVTRGAPSGDGTAPSGAPSAPASLTATELLAAAKTGNVDAQLKLGNAYLGVKPPNAQEALKWFRTASDKGSGIAAFNIGVMYTEGVAVPKNPAEGAKWHRIAADRGYAGAQNALGRLYETGQGVPQDFSEAVKWFRLAADQKNSSGQNNLGFMYESGRGVAANRVEAVRLYRLAADQGNAVAQSNLGFQYLAGQGVAQNDSAAYFWLNLGAANLPTSMTTMRDRVVRGRDAASKKLAPAELERVQHLAAVWKPGSADVPAEIPGDSARPQPANVAAARPPAGLPGGQPSPRGSGTGFVISQSGFVLTNNHVIAECTEVRARHGANPLGTLTSVARDAQNDLALLKLPVRFAEPTAAFRDGAPRLGDGVVVYGFPLVGMLAPQGNLTTGSISALAGLANDSRMLQISAPVQPGNSGGPLLDAGGNVVGVINMKLNALRTAAATGDIPQNVNFAIKASIARNFLDANSIDYQTATATRELKPADIADRAKKFTLLIECWR